MLGADDVVLAEFSGFWARGAAIGSSSLDRAELCRFFFLSGSVREFSPEGALPVDESVPRGGGVWCFDGPVAGGGGLPSAYSLSLEAGLGHAHFFFGAGRGHGDFPSRHWFVCFCGFDGECYFFGQSLDTLL